MASSVLRRQASWDVCKDNARQTETVHSEWKNYSFLKRHHGAKSQQECITLAFSCLQKNSVLEVHLIELATAESNTHMCYFTVSRSSQIDSKTPALASHQAAPQLTDAFKIMLLLWNGRLKCKINVENNNKSVWFIARFADVMTKTED